MKLESEKPFESDPFVYQHDWSEPYQIDENQFYKISFREYLFVTFWRFENYLAFFLVKGEQLLSEVSMYGNKKVRNFK